MLEQKTENSGQGKDVNRCLVILSILPGFKSPRSCLICFAWLERETGIEPATSSLGN